jgi:hypothetical protein
VSVMFLPRSWLVLISRSHWVSEFAPIRYQKILSYVTGKDSVCSK